MILLRRYWRFIAGGLALLALVGLFAQVNHWRTQAGRLAAAEKALANEQAAHRAAVAAYAADIREATQARERYAADVQAIRDRYAGLLAEVRPALLVKNVEVPGENCPRARLSDDFRLRFNAASP